MNLDDFIPINANIIKKGYLVWHPNYGYGEVLSKEKNGRILEIKFFNCNFSDYKGETILRIRQDVVPKMKMKKQEKEPEKRRIRWYKGGKLIKKFEQFDIDPYGEENWDQKMLSETPLYLSEDQPKVYDDGTPLQRPWIGKNLVLIKKDNNYYSLGEIRYGKGDFMMFYADYKHIEIGGLRVFFGNVKRELTNREKEHVLDVLLKGKRFPANFMLPSKSYYDIIEEFI
jgi:hypothetical protein